MPHSTHTRHTRMTTARTGTPGHPDASPVPVAPPVCTARSLFSVLRACGLCRVRPEVQYSIVGGFVSNAIKCPIIIKGPQLQVVHLERRLVKLRIISIGGEAGRVPEQTQDQHVQAVRGTWFLVIEDKGWISLRSLPYGRQRSSCQCRVGR